ncbi:MFS transporter [Rhodococcus sp. NPDC055024]
MSKHSDPPILSAKQVNRSVRATALGNVVEWFDYGVYSYAATTIGLHFFPSESPTAAALSSFAVLALSFLMRPIGGLVIGPLGDRYGRRAMLMLTIGLMTLGTVMIGVLPTYASVGVLAPVLLVLARLVQGFSAGGEYSGANIFMAEMAPPNRRGLFGSLLESGVLIGYITGAMTVVGLSSWLGDSAFFEWGWRIPFLVSLPLGILAFLLRRDLPETPIFERMKASGATVQKPLVNSFRRAPRPIVLTILIVALGNGAYYVILTFLPTYLESDLGVSSATALALGIVTMLAMMVATPLFGILGDKLGRRPLLATTCVAYFVFGIPFVALLDTGNVVLLALAMVLLGVMLTPMSSQTAPALLVLFPRTIRYTGYTFAFNISTALFGGTAPLLVGSLLNITGNHYVLGIYLMVYAVIAVVGVALMPETRTLTADHDMNLAEIERMTNQVVEVRETAVDRKARQH